jgi:hypothetical protein
MISRRLIDHLIVAEEKRARYQLPILSAWKCCIAMRREA